MYDKLSFHYASWHWLHMVINMRNKRIQFRREFIAIKHREFNAATIIDSNCCRSVFSEAYHSVHLLLSMHLIAVDLRSFLWNLYLRSATYMALLHDLTNIRICRNPVPLPVYTDQYWHFRKIPVPVGFHCTSTGIRQPQIACGLWHP